MSEALSVYRDGPLFQPTRELAETVRNTVFPNSTDAEIQLFFHDCHRNGIHPLDRMIHPQVYTDKNGKRRYVAVTSIDLFRSRAGDTGELAGIDDAVFIEGDPFPIAATVTVYRMVNGQRCPFTATARWSEYLPPPPKDSMWRKMPRTMLAKCAEGAALRKGFPKQLAGLYTKDEMEQAGDEPRTPRKGELVRGHPESEAAVVEAVESGELVPAQVGEGSTEGRFQPDQAEEFKKLHGMAALRGLFGGKSTPAGRRNYLCAELGRVIAKLEDVKPEEWLLVKSAVVRLIEQSRENGGDSHDQLSEMREADGSRADRPHLHGSHVVAGAAHPHEHANIVGPRSEAQAVAPSRSGPAPENQDRESSKGQEHARVASTSPHESVPGPDRIPSKIEMDAIRRAWFGAIARAAEADVSVGPIHASVCQGTDSTSSEYRRCLLEQLLRRDVASKDDVSVSEWQEAIKRLNDLAAGVLPLDAA